MGNWSLRRSRRTGAARSYLFLSESAVPNAMEKKERKRTT
jgi:hypothetical protein